MGSTPWRIAMATSIGTSHNASGAPCQDSHHHRLLFDACGKEVLVLVAADGAGTADRSDIGSDLSCQKFGELVATYLENGGQVEGITRPVIEDWLMYIVDELSSRAAADGARLRDYACTLLAVISGETATAFVQVGDGAIVVSHGEEDGWTWVFWPQHGEFANTTNFLISVDVMESFDFVIASRPVNEVALFTDGIENLVLHRATKTVHEPFFNNIFRAVRGSIASGEDLALSEALGKYLAAPVISDRTDDDKTLILASRRLVEPATVLQGDK